MKNKTTSDREIVHTFPFKSKSNPANSYECLLYKDGSTSCNCPGWTRRTMPNGNRECKHTMLVDTMKDVYLNGAVPNTAVVTKGKKSKSTDTPSGRKFDFSV